MTLDQLQTYIVGVLQEYFPNKAVLDKLSESANGTLLFNGQQISGETLVTDAELQQAIKDTLAQLSDEGISASVASFAALQTAIANGANNITITKPLSITSDITLRADTPVKINTNKIENALTVSGGTLTLGENVSISSDMSILYATENGIINIEGANLYSGGEHVLGFADKNSVINVISGKIVTEGNSALSVSGVNAQINISGGTIQTKNATFATVYSKLGGTVNVTGGEILNGGKAGDSYTLIAASDGNVNMSGGSVDHGVLAHETAKAKVTISGDARVSGPIGVSHSATLIITGGIFDTDPSAYVPDGYTVLDSNNAYTVIKNV